MIFQKPGYLGLIIDIGASEGNDTAYYLAKGFQVITIEADPRTYEALKSRFAKELLDNQLLLLNFAASDSFGRLVTIFVHNRYQGVSGIAKRQEIPDDYVENEVVTVDWTTLVSQGMPRYVKIDIEGNEVAFLTGMLERGDTPEFISVECYNFEVVKLLIRMGYQRFKLVDQTSGFKLPDPQLEGKQVAAPDFAHASGPFGLDVFGSGDWLNEDSIGPAWLEAEKRFNRTWYDCHAWKPL